MTKLRSPVRIVFGVLWLIFGLNFFFQFFQLPPPAPAAGEFLGALYNSGYFLHFVKLVEVVVGVCLVLNLFVPLSLVIIAPVTINIFLVHLFLDPAGLAAGVLMLILNVVLGYLYRDSFKEVLRVRG